MSSLPAERCAVRCFDIPVWKSRSLCAPRETLSETMSRFTVTADLASFKPSQRQAAAYCLSSYLSLNRADRANEIEEDLHSPKVGYTEGMLKALNIGCASKPNPYNTSASLTFVAIEPKCKPA